MNPELNMAALHQAAERWNADDLDGYLALYGPNIVLHGYAGVEPGIASVRAFYKAFCGAFPQSRLIFEEVFAAADRVVCRFQVEAIQRGAFLGIPPTGRRIVLPGITILRFSGGKCVERWSQADFLGLMQQLGALAAPA